jgi:hypothetical protein
MIRRSIREIRARDPHITVSEFRDALADKFHRGISWKYVAKLSSSIGGSMRMCVFVTNVKVIETLALAFLRMTH